MNNFNNIYSFIKKHCSVEEEDSNTQNDCVKKIQQEILITNGMGIYHYLDALQEMGFIEYSRYSGSVRLTEKGKETEKLFTY